MSLRLLSPLGHEHLIDCFLGVETVPSSVTVEVILRIRDDVELVAATATAGDELVHALFALLALLLESSLLLQRRHLVVVYAAYARQLPFALGTPGGSVPHEMLLRVRHLPQLANFAQLACLQDLEATDFAAQVVYEGGDDGGWEVAQEVAEAASRSAGDGEQEESWLHLDG